MPSDFELLDRWRAGDRDAGNELFERHFSSVTRFFRNKTADSFEDLIQKTFLGCVEGRERFRSQSTFRTYLFAVAHNVLRHHLRTKARHGDRVDFGMKSVHDLAPGPTTILAHRREQRLLLEGLRRVPIDFQVALELYYWEHLTAAQVADVLEVPEGTARSRIRRGKELLRERMAEMAQCGSEPIDLNESSVDLEAWARSLRDAAGIRR